MSEVTPKYYKASCPKCKHTMDPYTVMVAYGLKHPCLQHAVKKLLRIERDSHKPGSQEIQEVIDTLVRWQEMNEIEHVQKS